MPTPLARPGVAGTNAPAGAPAQATAGCNGLDGKQGETSGGPSISIFHIGIGSLNITTSTQYRPVTQTAGGAGGTFAAAATSGTGGYSEVSYGQGAGNGNAGPAGSQGPAGQLFRLWNNGTTTT